MITAENRQHFAGANGNAKLAESLKPTLNAPKGAEQWYIDARLFRLIQSRL